MEDPEAAFIKNGRKIYNNGYSIHTVDTTSNYASGHVSEPPPRPSYRSSRFSGDLSFVDAASGASGDGSLQLKQVTGFNGAVMTSSSVKSIHHETNCWLRNL